MFNVQLDVQPVVIAQLVQHVIVNIVLMGFPVSHVLQIVEYVILLHVQLVIQDLLSLEDFVRHVLILYYLEALVVHHVVPLGHQ